MPPARFTPVGLQPVAVSCVSTAPPDADNPQTRPTLTARISWTTAAATRCAYRLTRSTARPSTPCLRWKNRAKPPASRRLQETSVGSVERKGGSTALDCPVTAFCNTTTASDFKHWYVCDQPSNTNSCTGDQNPLLTDHNTSGNPGSHTHATGGRLVEKKPTATPPAAYCGTTVMFPALPGLTVLG